jgi:hypothetical protein
MQCCFLYRSCHLKNFWFFVRDGGHSRNGWFSFSKGSCLKIGKWARMECEGSRWSRVKCNNLMIYFLCQSQFTCVQCVLCVCWQRKRA